MRTVGSRTRCVRAGFHIHESGYALIRTEGHGQRETAVRWETGRQDSVTGGLYLDGVSLNRTMREAVAELEAEIAAGRRPATVEHPAESPWVEAEAGRAMSADTLTDARRRPTKTQLKTLRALEYGGLGGEDGWRNEWQVGESARRSLGADHGSWYSRLAAVVARGWAERNEDQGYVRWRITPAGREALAAHAAGGDADA